jgi:2-keto-4-pentenoate hydratase/2-oxohepta-3-ene-1,7-dioic acid hydratase in catechol pathway
MKLARYIDDGRILYGVLEENTIHELKHAPFNGLERQGLTRGLDEVRILTPVFPQKIIAVGLNYRDHAEELGMPIPEEPILFMKPPSSLLAHEGEIIYPAMSGRVDYEGELALICGMECHNISPEETHSYILGYTCANDVTARDLQARDGQWTRAKSFDTFCPLGPYIETETDPGDLVVELRLNGETRQSSAAYNMIFPPAELFSFISRIMTLYPGDVILTGTPPGVGDLHPGDTVEVEIEGIGILRNTITTET